MKKRRGNKLYWGLQFSGWSIYTIILYINALSSKNVNSYTWWLLLEGMVVGIGVTHLFRNYVSEHNWKFFSLQKISSYVILSSIILGGIIMLFQTVSGSLFTGRSQFEFLKMLSNQIGASLLMFFWSLFYFSYHYIERTREQEILHLKREASNKEIELNNLKSQLNPHFMFNSMNSIRALIDENPENAKVAVTKLSNILRGSLMLGKRRWATFSEELALVKDYLALEKIRYEERLLTEIEFDEACNKALIPPLMLQTLVENGIKHGISTLSKGGKLSIHIKDIGKNILVIIVNSGSYQPNKSKEGIGVSNTMQRLKLMYHQEATIRIENISEGKVLTELKIPKILKNESSNH